MILRSLLVVSLLATGLMAQAPGAEDETERLARFKAVFVVNFAEYVSWSAEDSTGEFVIGILGSSPIAPHLIQVAQKRLMAERPIRVQILPDASPAQIDSVHVLVLGDETGITIEKLGERLQDRAVLTITDAPGAAKRGSCINFILVDGRLKFEVNPKAVRATGLKMSSHLLRLATLVE